MATSLRDPWLATSTVTPEDLASLEASGMNSLRRGYESGRLGTEANYNLARESSLRAAGDTAAADALRGQTQALQRRASIYAPAVGQVEDIDGVGSGLSWAAGQLGSTAASVQDPLLASTLLSGAGTALSFVPNPIAQVAGAGLRMGAAPLAAYDLSRRQLKGEQYGNLSADPTVTSRFTPQEIDDQAGTYGMVAGLLDSALPAMVGRQLGGAALRARPRISPAASIPLGLVGEGATEVAQGEGGRMQHEMLNPMRDASQDASLRLNEFLGGAVGAGGPVLAGAGAQALYGAARATPGAVKDAAGTVIDMAQAGASKAADAAAPYVDLAKEKAAPFTDDIKDGVVDLKAQFQAGRQERMSREDQDLLDLMPPKGVDPNDPQAFQAWFQEAGPRRSALINGRLAKMAEGGDATAADLLARMGNTADPEGQLTAEDEAVNHLKTGQGIRELAAEATKGLAARGGALAGKAAGKVAGAAAEAGKAALGAFRGRKKNSQWTGDEYEARKHAAMNAFDEAGKTAGDKQRSYQRAELMGEIMAARAEAEIPRYSAHRVKVPSSIPVLMREIGEEVASLAESWRAPVEGKARSATGTDKRTMERFDALKLDLSRIARSINAAYEDPTSVVEALRSAAASEAAPFFDYLQNEITAGPQKERQTRGEARGALLESIDPETRSRLLKQGIDLNNDQDGETLLGMVDDVARGKATPAARRALERELGKDNMERMLDALYRHTPESMAVEEAYARQTEQATTDSGFQVDENGDVVDATEVTDFDKRQAEKAVNKKPAARLYGFYGTPRPRNTGDPLAYDNEKVTKAAIKKWNDEARALREMGQEPDYSTDPRMNDARRPRLFNLAQQGEQIEQRKLALEKQLKVDQTPERMLEMLREEQAALRKKGDEDSKAELSARTKAIQKTEKALAEPNNPNAKSWLDETTKAFFLNRAGSWRTEARSAWDMMTEHDGIEPGAKPNPMFINKMLARYRDYMRQEGQRYKESNPARSKSAFEAVTLVNNTLLDRVDQSNGERPTRTTPKLRAQAWNDAQEFFKSHGMVVAERAPTEDAQTMTADRVLEMAKTGKKAAEATKVKDENGNPVPPPDVLVFRSTLADSKTSKPGDLYITTRELAAFARDARYATEGVDFEAADQSFSNKSKDTEYLRDLMDGITALADSGLVEGLPRIHGKNGKPQYFSEKSVPFDLPLVTKTYGGMKYAQEQRAKQPNRKDTTTDPDAPKYQEKVAREQDREFTTPSDAPADDAAMRARVVMPDGQYNADLFDKTRDTKKIKRLTTVDRMLNEEEDVLGNRESKRLESLAKREDKVVPSERERPNAGTVPDEYADQRRRSIIEGRTADGGATAAKSFPKMKMADLGAKHGETLRKMFEASFEDGVNEAKTWLRQAAAPAFDQKGLTGGGHLAAPVAYALGDGSGIGSTPAEKQLVRALRVEAARVIAKSELKPADKVRLARELAPAEGRDRIVAANVQKFLDKVSSGAPPMDTTSARTESMTRAQADAVSDEAVQEYNADTGSKYATAPSRTAALKEGAAPVGKLSARPSGAAKRKLNAQATQLHKELGRMGFGATHDSPIRHEGKFDWRKHALKGEGAFAFGAGTYLSTGDGVHRFYKKAFTEAAHQNHPGVMKLEDRLRELSMELSATVDREQEDRIQEKIYEVEADLADLVNSLGKSPTYQVSVDIPPERLLDWNKPLSEQGATVRLRAVKAFKDQGLRVLKEKLGAETPGKYDLTIATANDLTGKELYEALVEKLTPADERNRQKAKFKGQYAASDYLQSLGILGHFYAAANGSQGKTPNYVIYDDSKITTNFVAFNQQNPSSRVITQAEMDEARAYVLKTLGPQIKVDFKALTGYSGEWIDTQNVIEISTTPGAPAIQVAYHEALHAFFTKFVQNNPQAMQTLQALVDDPKILKRLEGLLAAHPKALADLADGEERLAYMYQFWAAGLLDLPTRRAGFFEAIREFFRRVFGLVTDSERAAAILEAFHQGKMADPSVAGQVIAKELDYGMLTTKAVRKIDNVVAKAQSVLLPSQMVLAKSDSATARELAPMLWTNPGDEEHGDKGEGYINAKTAAARQYKNLLDGYIRDLTDRDLADVTRLLQEGKATDLSSIAYAPHREAVKNIDALLKRFFRYMTDERGMQLGKIEAGYFPRVWHVGTLLEKQSDFIDMLMTKYDHVLADGAKSSGLSKREVAERIHSKIISSSVGEHLLPQRDDGVLEPFFASGKVRELNWLDTADSAPYQSKDLIGTLTGYFHNGARAAEYTHRFGQKGDVLDAKLKKIEQELLDAGAARFKKGEFKTADEGKEWAQRRMAQVHKAVGAIEGTLGSDIGSTWRNTSAWITVYENLRLLPLTLFSSVVDPLGLVARGGTMREAYDTFLRGMREVVTNWGDMVRKEPKPRQADQWEKLALAIGSVDAAMFSNHVADEYSSVYMTKRAAKINETFFRLNGMESWNKGVRVGATQAAVNFLQRHAKLPEVHSERWLKELGLTKADMTFDPEGQLVTDKNVLAVQKGITKDQAEVEIAKVHQAIRRWVEGAVLTPNAAQRPAWASDPHYSMFFHLKQFSYSFHQTILKRAVKEMNYGNMGPIGAFMWYVPVMIASDITKGLIQGGGELPSHMKGMDAGDWFLRGLYRSGVIGVGAIGVDAEADLASVAGPAVEQAIDAMGQPIGRTIVDALPAKPVFAEAFR